MSASESEHLQLVPIVPVSADEAAVPGFAGELDATCRSVLDATAELYARIGFEEAWACCMAIADGAPVGTCGFTSPPRDGAVELAYFTFPPFEDRGVATAMARALVARARAADPSVRVTARTLLERNASHRILEKLGFESAGTVRDPEDGEVALWVLPADDGL